MTIKKSLSFLLYVHDEKNIGNLVFKRSGSTVVCVSSLCARVASFLVYVCVCICARALFGRVVNLVHSIRQRKGECVRRHHFALFFLSFASMCSRSRSAVSHTLPPLSFSLPPSSRRNDNNNNDRHTNLSERCPTYLKSIPFTSVREITAS